MSSWGAAIAAGLAVAALLIVVPRAVVFEPEGREECERRGQEYVGLLNGAGRYADPVPEGARCLQASGGVVEVEVRFFADAALLDGVLALLYRLVCVIAPLATGLWLGFRLTRG